MRLAANNIYKLILTIFLLFSFNLYCIGENTFSDLEDSISGLKYLPVQDSGLIRSFYSFSDTRLKAVYGKKSYNGIPPHLFILKVLTDENFKNKEKYIKIVHPYLTKTFMSEKISLEDYYRSTIPETIKNYNPDSDNNLSKPLIEISNKIGIIEDIEKDFAIIPKGKEWLSIYQFHSLMNTEKSITNSDREIIKNWIDLKKALTEKNVKDLKIFSANLTKDVESAAENLNCSIEKVRFDVLYNILDLFSKAGILYLFSAIVFLIYIIIKNEKLNFTGNVLMILGLIFHLSGIILRWIAAGRAPLSNMYESMIFASLGIIIIFFVFDKTYKITFIKFICGIIGFVIMVLAHKLPFFDTRIQPLMPALQSSWLTYHVVSIMLSYSAFTLSFLLSAVYLISEQIKKRKILFFDKIPDLETIEFYNYKAISIGFPLLTLGIITGAIWANIAWGRPWAFDPKETWSAITWMIYAAFLHSRFISGWTGRRSIIISILGFFAVLFTYIGVNYLLPSLHSYV